jgi:hypothetical protein
VLLWDYREIPPRSLSTPAYFYAVTPSHRGETLAMYEVPAHYLHDDDEGFRQYATAMLVSIVNAHLAGRIDTNVMLEPATDRPVLFTMPTCLIGALWLQLAQSIDGNKQFRQCEACRAWFELAPDKARADKAYCSQACRSRAYRLRLKQAR